MRNDNTKEIQFWLLCDSSFISSAGIKRYVMTTGYGGVAICQRAGCGTLWDFRPTVNLIGYKRCLNVPFCFLNGLFFNDVCY